MTEQEVVVMAAKTAIDTYKKEVEGKRKREKESAIKNTKKLLKNYTFLKVHCECAVERLENDRPSEIAILLMELFDKKGALSLESITQTKRRTEIMLKHVNDMLLQYNKYCSRNEYDYYRVLEGNYIEKKSKDDIAEELGVSPRTVDRYLVKAIEDMSVLLWGIIAA